MHKNVLVLQWNIYFSIVINVRKLYKMCFTIAILIMSKDFKSFYNNEKCKCCIKINKNKKNCAIREELI